MPPGLLTSSGGSTGRAREPKMRSGFRVEIYLLKKKFIERRVDLQCCASFKCTTK